MDMINNRFGILLAQKRITEKRRISLSEVSKVTGISRQSLQAWENNTVTRFDLPIMDALCTYFNVGPDRLFEFINADGIIPNNPLTYKESAAQFLVPKKKK